VSKLKNKIYNNISLTNQTYESILQEFRDMFVGENSIDTSWDNLAETDIIMILMSIFAAHKDMLNYMLDYRTLEGFMSTAKERQSIVRIANSFGYKIQSFKAGMAEFKLLEGQAFLEFGTQLLDNNRIPWVYIDQDRQITSEDTIQLFQGTLYNTEINLSQVNNINKTYVLPSPSIAIGSTYQNKPLSKIILKHTIDEDIELKEVDSLYRYNSSDDFNVYELNVDPQGITYIRFHKDLDLEQYNDREALLYYVVTTGRLESTPSNINKALPENSEESELIDRMLVPTQVFFNGSDPLTAEEIKEDFKYYYASSDLLITQDDIKNFVLNIQSHVQDVNRCLVIDKQFDTEGFPSRGNDIPLGEVRVYVLKKDNTELAPVEVEDIQDEIDKHKMSGITITVNHSTNKLIPVDITVHTGFDTSDNEAFQDFLIDYINNLPIGSTITTGQISTAINNSVYNQYFNNNNGSIKLEANLSELKLEYNQYANLKKDNIEL